MLRLRPFEQETRSHEARSLTAALEQSVRGWVQNTVVSRNVEEAYEPGKDLDKKNNHKEKEGFAVIGDGTEEERILTKKDKRRENW